MKYLKEFDSFSKLCNYYKNENFITPNVFTFKENNDDKVDMNNDESLICLYDIPDLSDSSKTLWTTFNGDNNNLFESITIDGVKWNDVNVPAKYSDFETKKHIVKIKFKNNSNIGSAPFLYNDAVRSIYFPECLETLGNSSAWVSCSNLESLYFACYKIQNFNTSGIFWGAQNIKYIYWDINTSYQNNILSILGFNGQFNNSLKEFYR